MRNVEHKYIIVDLIWYFMENKIILVVEVYPPAYLNTLKL